MIERKRESTYTASFRLSLRPAVKAELEAKAAAAGISAADAARQFLDVGLRTAALGTKEQADTEMADSIVRAVAETVAAANAAMSALEDDVPKEQLETELHVLEKTRGYGALKHPGGKYDPWGLTEEVFSAARGRAVNTCERLAGLNPALADVIALLRQDESPALDFGEMDPIEADRIRSEIQFLVQIVLSVADESVWRSESDRIEGARARLVDAASSVAGEATTVRRA